MHSAKSRVCCLIPPLPIKIVTTNYGIRGILRKDFLCNKNFSLLVWTEYALTLCVKKITHRILIGLCNDPADVSFIYLGEVDEAGHLYGGISEEYESALSRVDEHVGEILDAVERRSSNYPDEDWLVCITTDHGHLDEGGHGGADPVLRRSFFGALRLGARSSDQYSFESMRPEQIAGWMLRHLDTPIR